MIIVRPENGATLTGESFILEATITEDRRLSEVLVTIAGGQGTVTFSASHSGQAPDFKLGPVRTQPLALGSNDITVTARDLVGNEGQDSATVTRVSLEATLVVPEGPVVLRRLPFRNAVEVRLEETFTGSLDGRDEIDIRVAGPDGVRGQVRIRDFLNQPEPRAILEIFATSAARLGEASVFLHAVEVETGRIITTADLLMSIVPPNPLECTGTIPFYRASTPEDVRQEMEAAIDAAIADDPDVSALTPLQLTFAAGQIRIFRRFHVKGPFHGFPTADINMSATIVRNPDVPFRELANAETLNEEQLPFTYQPFRVNTSPNIPVIDPMTAIAWAVAQGLFESKFSDRARTKFIRDFNVAIFERITATSEIAHLLLQETRIDTREFMFGFCIPSLSFPNPLIEDEFESDPLDQFAIVDDPGAIFAAPSSWSYDADGQRIVQTSNIHGPADHVNTRPDKPGTYLLGLHERKIEEEGEVRTVAGPWPAMRNFALECTVSSQDDDGIGVVFRYQDLENFYFFLMDAQRRYRRIGKKVGGVFQELEVAALDIGSGFDVGARHRILLMARDDTFSVYIDGVEALSGSDRAISKKGRIGLYAWGNSAARFETLKIRPF